MALDPIADRSANGKMPNLSGPRRGVMQFAWCVSLEAFVNCVTNTKDASAICEPPRRGTATVVA
jgi:hypothetical protein